MENTLQMYNKIAIDSDVLSANSHRLIQLLIHKSVVHIEAAKQQILDGKIIEKCQSMKKAMDIIAYLRFCLNVNDERCKDLAMELSRLYTYIEKRLMEAHMFNIVEPLDESINLINIIRSGWDGCGEKLKETTHV